jgi:hypothetical protein
MGELIDRWILPLAGGAVMRCCINHGLTIEVASNGAAAATILIGGAFELQSADDSWQLSPAGKAVDLAPALVLRGLEVDYAAAHKDGTLAMVFADGIRSRLPPGRGVRGVGVRRGPRGESDRLARRRHCNRRSAA